MSPCPHQVLLIPVPLSSNLMGFVRGLPQPRREFEVVVTKEGEDFILNYLLKLYF